MDVFEASVSGFLLTRTLLQPRYHGAILLELPYPGRSVADTASAQ